jgi:Cu/Ag efflux pump CusA
MIVGIIPLALGLGEGGEQNAPLGRAVIGGLVFGTAATLTFVPVLFSLLVKRRGGPTEAERLGEGRSAVRTQSAAVVN